MKQKGGPTNTEHCFQQCSAWPGIGVHLTEESAFTFPGIRNEAFLKRFPILAPFVMGLQLRMKALAHVHIRALLRLVASYGEKAFLEATTRAQEYRRFDARAVERILERHYPLLDDTSLPPLGGVGAILIGDVETGSLDDYSNLDHEPDSADDDDSEENNGS